MKKIRVFETFAGIGSQNKALSILKKQGILDFEIASTSEWDIWANIAYNSIHHNNKNIASKKSTEEIKNYLSKFTHSNNSKTPVSIDYVMRQERIVQELLYSSYANANNLGSIISITGQELMDYAGDIDLITYSFPCQDLSVAGSFHGFNKGMKKGSGTRSGLLWEIERILGDLDVLNKKPKYMLLENVKNMISDRHIDDYKMWLNRLNELGYKTQTFVLKANEFGAPQIRQRVYALSILDASDDFEDTLIDTEQIISKIIINNNSKKYKINKSLIDILQLDFDDKKILQETIDTIPNRTPSRERMFNGNPILYTNNEKLFATLDSKKYTSKTGKIGHYLGYTRTLTTKQDRHPNAGVLDLRNTKAERNSLLKLGYDVKNKANYRFVTTREAYMLMGFESSDYDKVKIPNFINKDILYRQAGNSIVVNVLVAIFEYMLEVK